ERGWLGLAELGVRGACGGSALPAEGEHLGGDVGGDDVSVRSSLACRGQRGLAVARRDVEHAAARTYACQLDQTVADGLRRGGHLVNPLFPAGRRVVPLVARRLTELGRLDSLAFHSLSLGPGQRKSKAR